MEKKQLSSSEDTHLISKTEDDEKDENKRKCSRCAEFPASIYYIVATEFCERYSYYGMRTILVIYLTRHLMMRDNTATAVYHFFVCLCYFTPLLGGYLSDSFFGKFKTIAILAVVYAVGSSVMSFTAMAPPNLAGPVVGLVLIGFGTGGIKPCVSALGGDQLPANNKELLDSYFSLFYFCINAGSLLSTYFTPMLRAHVYCFGGDCYPLAFGVPAILMVLAIVIFICGRKHYTIAPLTENVIGKGIRCIIHAWCNWFKQRKSDPKDGVMDYASDTYDTAFISDVRAVLGIVFLFLPLPIFWALYDQQGSRWTLQAAKLDGYMFAGWVLQPDQMSTANTLLILLLIPLFESVIYPLLNKLKVPNRPLQRMTAGMFLSSVAFLCAFFLQLAIERDRPVLLAEGMTEIRLVNLGPCPASVAMTNSGNQFQRFALDRYSVGNGSTIVPAGMYRFEMTMDKCSLGPQTSVTSTIDLPLPPRSSSSLYLTLNPQRDQLSLQPLLEDRLVSRSGKAKLRAITMDTLLSGARLKLLTGGDVAASLSFNGSMNGQKSILVTPWTMAYRGFYTWHLSPPSNTPTDNSSTFLEPGGTTMKPADILSSSITTIAVVPTSVASTWRLVVVPEVSGLRMSMLYQIPQYFVITVAEILFSITGLSFAYDQAPKSMKSMVLAFWLMAIAVGNLVVVIVAEVQLLPRQSLEFLLFCLLSLLTTVIFAVLAHFYKPNPRNDYKDLDTHSEEQEQKAGQTMPLEQVE